jgi:hypothetical protein
MACSLPPECPFISIRHRILKSFHVRYLLRYYNKMLKKLNETAPFAASQEIL